MKYQGNILHTKATESATNGPAITYPLRMLDIVVLPAWIDYNNHMTEYRYLQVFAETTDALLRRIGLNDQHLESGHSYYTVETHIVHIDGLSVNQCAYTTTQIVDADEKRIHLFHQLFAADSSVIVATAEHMLLHVDVNANRTCVAPKKILAKLFPLARQHRALERPANSGRYIGQPR